MAKKYRKPRKTRKTMGNITIPHYMDYAIRTRAEAEGISMSLLVEKWLVKGSGLSIIDMENEYRVWEIKNKRG